MSIICQLPGGYHGSVYDLAFDREGNLYCGGRLDLPKAERERLGITNHGFKSPAWSFSPQGALRWYVKQRLSERDEARIAVGPDRAVYLWFRYHHSLFRLNPDTGEVRAELGGLEPDGARAPHLDLERCKALQIDQDGTIVAEIHDRLLRWSADGTPVRTWPPPNILLRLISFGLVGWERRRPLYKVSGQSSGFGDSGPDRTPIEGSFTRAVGLLPRPLGISGEWCLGWDGHLYVAEQCHDGGKEGLWLAKIDRSGDLVYKVRFKEYDLYRRKPQADAAGRAYLAVKTEQDQSVLVRVTADGREARQFAGSHDDSDPFAVAPDGTLAIDREELEILPPGARVSSAAEASEETGDASAGGSRRAWVAGLQSQLPSSSGAREATILLGVFALVGVLRILLLLFWFEPLVAHHARTNTQYESRSKHGVTRISAAKCRKAQALVPGEVTKEGVIAGLFLVLLLLARRHPVQALIASAIVMVLGHGVYWAVQPAVLGTMPEFWLTGWYFIISLTQGLTPPIAGVFLLRLAL
jgi:hypothetical protein